MHTLSEMQCIASEILLALGDAYSFDAYNVSTHQDWWVYLPEGKDPCSFSSGDEYFRHAVASSLFKKYEGFPGDADLQESAAWDLWLANEQHCFRTNQRFHSYIHSEEAFLGLDPEIREFLRLLQEEVCFVLGPCPNQVEPRLGPGATYDLRKHNIMVPVKLSTIPSMTADAWPFIRDWSQSAWRRSLTDDLFPTPDLQAWQNFKIRTLDIPATKLSFSPVRGNRYATVPKTRKIRRSIAAEPTINIYYQLAYGRKMRRRLQRFGQLLVPETHEIGDATLSYHDAESQKIHKELARKGSIDGSNATIDLKSASDTNAYSFVEFALQKCPRWFGVLNSLRSSITEKDGTAYHLEKFSSMGNGYTFELETLLFFCICRVALRMLGEDCRSVNVYGDDIIVPANCYRSVTAALRFCGFNINTTKSFHTGPFRESCGGDFYRGMDVRPPSITGEPTDPSGWVTVFNQLKRLEGRVNDVHLGNALKTCINNIPRELRNYGPQALGDEVLHSDDESEWAVKMRVYKNPHKTGRRGHAIPHIRITHARREKYSWDRFCEPSMAVSRLYGLDASGVPFRNAPIAEITCRWIPWTPGLS